TLRLRDGRTLGTHEFGDPEGAPVFYFHGHPGCGREATILHDAAVDAHLRIVALDRPGMGRSTYQRGRRIADGSRDVAEAADQLQVGPFKVIGFSGGGPYAL